MNVLSSMFVKNERKLRALCGDWCRYYEPQRRRNNNVIFYYDSTAKQGGSYAVENADATRFNTVVKEELTKRGWKVTEVYMGNPMGHQQKFTYINDVLIRFRSDPYDMKAEGLVPCQTVNESRLHWRKSSRSRA